MKLRRQDAYTFAITENFGDAIRRPFILATGLDVSWIPFDPSSTWSAQTSGGRLLAALAPSSSLLAACHLTFVRGWGGRQSVAYRCMLDIPDTFVTSGYCMLESYSRETSVISNSPTIIGSDRVNLDYRKGL